MRSPTYAIINGIVINAASISCLTRSEIIRNDPILNGLALCAVTPHVFALNAVAQRCRPHGYRRRDVALTNVAQGAPLRDVALSDVAFNHVVLKEDVVEGVVLNDVVLGDLANEVGWKHQDLLKKLEDKRKTKADAYYQKKKARDALKAKATAAAESELAEVNKVLAASGY